MVAIAFPDADAALLTLIRLREEMGPQWAALDQELSANTALRGRLLSVIGSSLALGDHLVAHPDRWQLLVGEVELESKETLQERFLKVVGAIDGRASVSEFVAISALRDAYRDRLLVLAALDLAATVENEPVLPFPVVGQHLADLADAALTAALAVAVSLVVPEGQEPPGSRLSRWANAVRASSITSVMSTSSSWGAGRLADHPCCRGDDAGGLEHLLRGGRGAAPGG